MKSPFPLFLPQMNVARDIADEWIVKSNGNDSEHLVTTTVTNTSAVSSGQIDCFSHFPPPYGFSV